ncbi:MAG: hypothetical protein MEQ07_03415 [Aquimonas sp.]|nr:hypothetical protein [Aquimonas sp.]
MILTHFGSLCFRPAAARSGAAGLALLALAVGSADPAQARPVSYAQGHMLMADHSAELDHWSYTYSPSFRWSGSAGFLRLDDLVGTDQLELSYVRGSRLLKRWNLPAAQANVFGWVGAGSARTFYGRDLARHVGFQADYETRRIYTAVISELHEGPDWSHRMDTVSLGWAPYLHDIDRMATWVVAKGMRTSNAVDESFNPALVLRFFTVRWWLEVGADGDGKPLANLMINL